MEFLLDTANRKEIQKLVKEMPFLGITTNPSLVKNEGKIDFFAHMKEIRSIIGKERSLHIQVVAPDYEGMIKDAETIIEKIDPEVYIKVPATKIGLSVMKELKRRNVNVTATAIYTAFQGYLAIASKADYIAPYFNRMENLNIAADAVLQELADELIRTKSETKILAASFKNVAQVNCAIKAGVQAVTIDSVILQQAFSMASINQAVTDFTMDWETTFGTGTAIHNLT